MIHIPKNRPSRRGRRGFADYAAAVNPIAAHAAGVIRASPCSPPTGEAARYSLYHLDRFERMIPRRIARDYFVLDGETKTDTAMTEELEQLGENLKLRRILNIL